MPAPITSLQNPRVKQTARLRDRRAREKQQRMIIDGIREVTRAIETGLTLDEVFYDPARQDEAVASLLADLNRRGVTCLPVTDRVLDKLAFGQRNEGLVATAATPRRTLGDLTLPDNPLVVVVEGIEKPGNLGAIFRSADAAGASALIVVDGGTDLFNPNAIRASLGALFTVPACSATAVATADWLREHGCRIFAARLDADCNYTQADMTGPTAIVLGSEASGLSAAWQGPHVFPIKLPMLGRVDSLNVSTTAAVLLYEAIRQRSHH